MGILDVFRRAPKAPMQVGERESSVLPVESRTILKALSLRPGMWVMTADGVGVIRDYGANGLLDVMAVDAAGHNRLQVLVDPSQVRQATLSEIPRERHHPDKNLMNALGYY